MPILTLNHKFGCILVYPVSDVQPAQEKPEVLEVLGALGSVTLGASTLEGLGFWAPTGEFERAIHVFTNYDGDPGTLVDLKAATLPVVSRWAVNTGQQAVAFEYDASLVILDTADLVEVA